MHNKNMNTICALDYRQQPIQLYTRHRYKTFEAKRKHRSPLVLYVTNFANIHEVQSKKQLNNQRSTI